MLYKDNIKRISPELINYLTPMSLAFLIMVGGTWLPYSKSVRIATNSFTMQEVNLFRSMLETKFGLQTIRQLQAADFVSRPLKKREIVLKINIQFILKPIQCQR